MFPHTKTYGKKLALFYRPIVALSESVIPDCRLLRHLQYLLWNNTNFCNVVSELFWRYNCITWHFVSLHIMIWHCFIGYLSGSHLNYSEVVFQAGPSSNSNIIHGADDKTIYTEIDLASSARFHHDCSDTNSDEDFIYLDGIVNLERKNEIKWRFLQSIVASHTVTYSC